MPQDRINCVVEVMPQSSLRAAAGFGLQLRARPCSAPSAAQPHLPPFLPFSELFLKLQRVHPKPCLRLSFPKTQTKMDQDQRQRAPQEAGAGVQVGVNKGPDEGPDGWAEIGEEDTASATLRFSFHSPGQLSLGKPLFKPTPPALWSGSGILPP